MKKFSLRAFAASRQTLKAVVLLLTLVFASYFLIFQPKPVTTKEKSSPEKFNPSPEWSEWTGEQVSNGKRDLGGFNKPTYSSPISLSADNNFVWVVNPDDDSVSVIRTDTDTVVTKIPVGDEPQSVALTPDGGSAWVAEAAGNTVSIIRITNSNPNSFQASAAGRLRTGAEPWNVVVSPDGNRIFVANSSQDTITVIDPGPSPGFVRPRIIGNVNLRNSVCNDPDRNRHFQPRGLAVTQDNTKLYVTRFLSFTRPGGRQGDDNGKEGVVCRLNIDTNSQFISGYQPVSYTTLAPQVTGFNVDSTGDGVADPTSAFPNQMQSIVIRGNRAFMPNIAASPSGPLRFNVNTQAFLSVLNNVNGASQSDGGALNLHLGARDPEPGKTRLFFANPWAVAFTNQSGAGNAYVVSAGSDLLVKLNIDASDTPSFTVDSNTTRYIDLNDPNNSATSGANAGKNPLGIVINDAGNKAYVMNFVSRNVSVVNLTTDSVSKVIRTTNLPSPGSLAEQVQVGAEIFFSSRGHFNRPAGTTVSTEDRLSSEGWQNCASCHFQGLTDGVVWAFGVGPRKSVPLNASFNPHNPNDQRVLNYSAIFDEIQDFELNIRNVSGPGNLASAVPCANPPGGTSLFDPNHGLLYADDGDINKPPCTINAFVLPNAGRQQHKVTLPGSNVAWPALDAMKEWVRFAIRSPNGPLTDDEVFGGVPQTEVNAGRDLFQAVGCASCHGGGKWTISAKDFISPPAGSEIFTERTPPQLFGNPVGAQYLARFLRNIGSFNLGVPGQGNPIGNNIGADEKASAALVAGVAQPAQDALGIDYNGDGRGNGYNVPSLLSINAVPPFYHNGACETIDCVLTDRRHRNFFGTRFDPLSDAFIRGLLARYVESIDAETPPFLGF